MGDGVDAPQRHRCAEVVVLSHRLRGRRPWKKLAPSAWISQSRSFTRMALMRRVQQCSAALLRP